MTRSGIESTRRAHAAEAATGWTRTARWLHWSTALAIAVEVPAGFTMAWTYLDGVKGGPLAGLQIRASQVHHTLGMILLFTTLFRLYWRGRHPAPALPSEVSAPGRLLARIVQAALYALLLLIPLSGWAALSALAGGAGFPAPEMWFFGHDGFGPGGIIPHLVAPRPWNDPLGYGLFARAHVWMLWAGGGLLALHIGGAMKHHLLDRTPVLLRMMGRK
ncbi:cytochrome b [Rhizorhabdus sp. FW153]|uniref:cytochrome b n=1 Tax=Rhizorhabdus sp. FW153 TaxID=3400216 RepID=UPI003CF1144B